YYVLFVLPSFPTRRSSDLFLNIYSLFFSYNKLFSKNCFSAGPRRFFPTILPSGSIIKDAGIAVMLYRRPAPLSHILRSDNCVHRSEEHTSELQSRENLVCR